jgi:hypothetical protein
VTAALPGESLDSSFGIDLFTRSGTVIRLGGTYQSSGDTTITGEWLKVSVPLH